MKKFFKEFREFIEKGNAFDLAVGVVIGGAFSKIVSSLVDDIIMPVLGVIVGGIDFSNLTIDFGNASIKYGSFLQNVVDFLIVAFCIFIVIRSINSIKSRVQKLEEKRKKEEKKEEIKEEVVKSDEVLLLEEIRNLLKKKDK